MSQNVFHLQNLQPNKEMLSEKLGKSLQWYEEIVDFIEEHYQQCTVEWKYYGQKSGWVIKLLHNKRNTLFVVPCQGFFRVVFTFGERSVAKIQGSNLPKFVVKEVLKTRKYSEGRTIQMEIMNKSQIETVFDLIRLKLES